MKMFKGTRKNDRRAVDLIPTHAPRSDRMLLFRDSTVVMVRYRTQDTGSRLKTIMSRMIIKEMGGKPSKSR
jgi:hypothetical protein